MVLSIIIVAIVLSREVESIEKEFEELNDRSRQISDLLEKIRFSALRIVSSTSEYLLLTVSQQHRDRNDSQDIEGSTRNESDLVKAAIADLDEQLTRYRKLVVTFFPDELEFLETIEVQRVLLVQQSSDLVLAESGITGIAELVEAKERFETTEKLFLQAVDLALEHELVEYNENVTDLKNSIIFTSTLIWIGLAGSAFIFLMVGGVIIRSVTNPLGKLSSAIDNVGRGDYSQELRMSKQDEIGKLTASFNSMANQLQKNKKLQHDFIQQLEQKNSELERFTYTVSHDLKSPLVTLKGFLGMLEKDIESDQKDQAYKDIEVLKEATDTMGMLLNDLLELSRVGRVINPPTLISMTDLCNKVVSALQGLIMEHHAEIEIMPDMPVIYADRGRVKEVLQNLLENAIKFSRDGEHPKINVYSETRDGDTFFVVEDNGIGVESAYHDKIFMLFERLDPKVDGTGVGLALVKRIVETHGGKIWVESPADLEGSRFCFTLPHSLETPAIAQTSVPG